MVRGFIDVLVGRFAESRGPRLARSDIEVRPVRTVTSRFGAPASAARFLERVRNSNPRS